MKKVIPKNVEKIIEEFVNKVNKKLGNRVKKNYTLWFICKGDFNKSSDIDIMILTNLSDDEICEYRSIISDIAYDIEYENDFNITLSPLLKNIDKYNYWLEAMPFYNNIQKEGVVLSGS